VPRETLVECLERDAQAPTGGGAEDWRFVVVGDPAVRARVAQVYLRAYRTHVEQPLAENLDHPVARVRLRAVGDAATDRMLAGAKHLGENIGRAPWLVIPCACGDR
jgi:nitroreductase